MMRKHIPNMVTGCRIALSLALLWPMPLSTAYLALYALAGLTDMLDGFLARRLKAESAFGSRLDTVADMAMLAAALYTLWPYLPLEDAALGWLGGVAAVKMVSLAVYGVRWRRLLSHHSLLNKAVGGLLYLYPFTLTQPWKAEAVYGLLALATVAALEELLAVICGSRHGSGKAAQNKGVAGEMTDGTEPRA